MNVTESAWQTQCGRDSVTETVWQWQCQCERDSETVWQCQCDRDSVAVPWWQTRNGFGPLPLFLTKCSVALLYVDQRKIAATAAWLTAWRITRCESLKLLILFFSLLFTFFFSHGNGWSHFFVPSLCRLENQILNDFPSFCTKITTRLFLYQTCQIFQCHSKIVLLSFQIWF